MRCGDAKKRTCKINFVGNYMFAYGLVCGHGSHAPFGASLDCNTHTHTRYRNIIENNRTCGVVTGLAVPHFVRSMMNTIILTGPWGAEPAPDTTCCRVRRPSCVLPGQVTRSDFARRWWRTAGLRLM